MSSANDDVYEVYAVRYAHMAERPRRMNFIVSDPHDDGDMPMDYFVWVITNARRSIVVDTGFDAAEARARGRTLLRLPREGLALLGVDAATVQDVVITHMHYDHAGTLDDFPQAGFHLQDLEMSYATGRHMCRRPFGYAYTADHVKAMVDRVFDGKVVFHDGDGTVAPGVSVHRIGGHTRGLQCVRVSTARGWLVLASDASHYYENMDADAPFPIVYNLADMIDGYGRMRALASSPGQVIPGHDPLVLARYTAPEPSLQGIVARLDVAPAGSGD